MSFSYTLSPIEYVRNYDGDTVTVNIPSVHPLLGHKIGIRLRGIDTPEIKSKLACERKMALKAKEFVAKRLAAAKNIVLKEAARGKYFRIESNLIYDGKNLNRELLTSKLARVSDGSKNRTVFCN